jgi:hypothetical protein
MTGREWLARGAAWSLPPQERSEPVHTALDVSQGSLLRFVRELAGLTWYGYRRRGAHVAGTRADRVLADGLCQGAVWVVIFELADLLAHIRTERIGLLPGTAARPGAVQLDSRPAAVLLAVALALALIGLDRLAGLAGLGWLAVWTPVLAHYRTPVGLSALLVPLLGYLVLLAAPRWRPLDPWRLLWFAVPVALAITTGPGNPSTGLIWIPVVLAVAGAAVLTLPSDPRLAIAAALPISYLGAQSARHGEPAAFVVTSTVFVVLALALLFRRLWTPEPGATRADGNGSEAPPGDGLNTASA